MRNLCQREKLGSLNVSLVKLKLNVKLVKLNVKLGIGINDDVIRLEMIMLFLNSIQEFYDRLDDFS